MRFMVIVKGNKDSEAGVLPDEKELTEMSKFNEELVKAGERVCLNELDGLLVVTYRHQSLREIELRTGRSRAVRLRPARSNKKAGTATQV